MKTEMIIIFNRGNEYFDTYYIYDEKGRTVGIIEDHCRGVKKQYFIGWKLNKPNDSIGKTQMFDTKEEAMMYSVGQVVSDINDLFIVRTKVKDIDSALNRAKMYLAQGLIVTITPTEDGYLIENYSPEPIK